MSLNYLIASLYERGSTMTYQNKGNLTAFKSACILFTVAIISIPFFRQYASFIPGVNIADLLLAGASIAVLLLNRKKNINWKRVKPLILLWFFGTFVSLLSFTVQQEVTIDNITRIIRFSFYVILIILSASYFERKIALKFYKGLCILLSIYIILQVAIYHSIGIILPFKILPMPWIDGRIFDISDAMAWAERWYFVPSGVFIEPGYAAQFLLPGLALSLYGWLKHKKTDVKSTILIFTAIILTTSSQGIFIGTLILGLYIIFRAKRSNNRLRLLKNAFIIALFFVFIILFMNLDGVQNSIEKVTGEIQGGSSTSFRIYRGGEIFLQLPVLFKVIGVGHGNIGNFVVENMIITKYDPAILTPIAADYANGISTVLLYYGVLGFILLINLYWNLWRNTKDAFRLIVITLVVLSMVASLYFSILMVFYISLIYAGYNFYENDSDLKEG